MTTLSVCIGTHERAELLVRALDGLCGQERMADEIIVSDSSSTDDSKRLIEQYSRLRPEARIRRIQASSAALPRHRWLAFAESSGDIVLFLDDDVKLEPAGLKVLVESYERLAAESGEPPAGVGFTMTWDDGDRPVRDRMELRERWLKTSSYAPGSLTPGGIAVSWAEFDERDPMQVQHLWGGAMSFRRDVLAQIGYLDRLVELYENGIGRGEDGVLSSRAGLHGRLYLLPVPLAKHPRGSGRRPTPYAAGGWKMGLTPTWGRAHTMRWLATDLGSYRRDLVRMMSLELARSLQELIRRPLSSSSWSRLAGGICGMGLTAVTWKRIPKSAQSEAAGPERENPAHRSDRSPSESAS